LEGFKLKLCYDLNLLVVQKPKADALILVHLTDDEKQLKDIEALCQLDCHVICLSNTPTSEEGAALFKKGIKGYLNTFASYDNITQALEVVQSGNVWLGQLVMNAMITSLPADNLPSMAWKDDLTEREIDTANLLLKGHSNREIAAELDLSAADVYGTASFYSFLDTEVRGKYIIRICRTVVCDMQGRDGIMKALKGILKINVGETTHDNKFSLLETNCLGWCAEGPAMLINDKVYTKLTPEKIRTILHDYIND